MVRQQMTPLPSFMTPSRSPRAISAPVLVVMQPAMSRKARKAPGVPPPPWATVTSASTRSGFTEKLAEAETEYKQTLLAKVVKETEAESFRPLEQLFAALGIQESGATYCPVTHQHAAPSGVQAQPGVAGPTVQVTSSTVVKPSANSLLLYHENNTDPEKFPGDINHPSPGPESAVQSAFIRTDSGQKRQDTISVSNHHRRHQAP